MLMLPKREDPYVRCSVQNGPHKGCYRSRPIGQNGDGMEIGHCGSPGLTVEMSALRRKADVNGFAAYFRNP